jgi:hypothetical protein
VFDVPQEIKLENQIQFRIIPSVYPPINFFEDLVDASEMETLWEIEKLTNDRLLQEVGNIFLVKPEDRVSGLGASVVMAAFTHIHYPSRFTDGSFGIYYASLSRETAIRETVYHRELFLQATQEEALELTMRVYAGKVLKPLHDIRGKDYKHLHHPTHYSESQNFGYELRNINAWGLIYNSVRHPGGCCIAALRPPAISIPIQAAHLKYIWNGKKIIDVLEANSILKL